VYKRDTDDAKDRLIVVDGSPMSIDSSRRTKMEKEGEKQSVTR
jgi:hypothetical protein